MKCPIHPKFKGRKEPKMCLNKACICLKLYLVLKNKPRMPFKPTRVIKDKTKYDRKKKHKNKDE